MGKRFIDTDLFDDDWFMDLTKDAKLLWIYFITKCDHAGMIKLNTKLCKLQTDIKDLNDVIKQLGNRILTVSEQFYFIPKFIEFQYPNFPNSNVRQQNSAIEILTKYNLFSNGSLTVSKGLTNPYVNDNVNVNDNVDVIVNEKPEILKTWKNDFEIFKSEIFAEFEKIKTDDKWIKEQERFNPNVDILLSIEKSITVFWATELGWKHKRQSKSANLDWRQTFAKNMDKNRVYKPKMQNGFKPIQPGDSRYIPTDFSDEQKF